MSRTGKIASEPQRFLLYFFDASALAKHYVEEAASDSVDELLRAGAPALCRTSEVEVASALTRLAREGVISPEQRNYALSTLREDMAAFQVIEVVRGVIDRAVLLLTRHPLRAADAIQLGACLVLQEKLRFPIAFVAFDQRLRQAAVAERLAVLPAL